MGQRAQLVSEDGRFAGLQAVARNITERKLVQQAIEREREQLRQIVTHAPVAMAMLDREGRHLAHSARWLRYLRTADPSVVGRTARRGLARDAGEVPAACSSGPSPARW